MNKRSLKKLIFFLIAAMVLIIFITASCSILREEEEEVFYEGRFLVANSWKENLNWENIDDGMYWIDFEAAKSVGLIAYTWAKNENNPKAVIRFDADCTKRSNYEIRVVVGDSSSDTRYYNRKFLDITKTLGTEEEPTEDIVIDITDAYGLLNTHNVYLVVYDKLVSGTGTVVDVKLQIWKDNAYHDAVADDYNASADNVIPGGSTTTNGKYKVFEFTNHQGTVGSAASKSTGSANGFGVDNLKILTEKISTNKLTKMKKQIGTYKKGFNYNKIYYGKSRTGLIPPTEAEWDELALKLNYITGIAKSRASGSTRSLSSSVNRSTEKYFPPIGDQGTKGSCASFHAAYYVQTYYMAKANDWDLSDVTWDSTAHAPDSEQDKIMSPDFVYQLVNGGIDDGSFVDDNAVVLTELGVCSWATMPYDDSFNPAWPEELAFEEAPKYRTKGKIGSYNLSVGGIVIENNNDIETVLELMDAGYLFVIGVDASSYDDLSDEDVWTESSLSADWEVDHANTVIGYELR